MSATYRQGNKPSPESMQKDARNEWLSHYPRRRLDAEQVRDQALALSGLLAPKLGGIVQYLTGGHRRDSGEASVHDRAMR